MAAGDQGCTQSVFTLYLTHKQDLKRQMALIKSGLVWSGTKRIECVEENCGAAAVKLTPEEMTELEAAVPHHEVNPTNCFLRPAASKAQYGQRCVVSLLS